MEELKTIRDLVYNDVVNDSKLKEEMVVELTELFPYMDETLITEDTFIKFGFERTDVSIEESGGEPYHFYTFDFGGSYDPTLISADNFNGFQFFTYDHYKTWRTEGELKMMLMLFVGDE